jgi:hypothetical protein
VKDGLVPIVCQKHVKAVLTVTVSMANVYATKVSWARNATRLVALTIVTNTEHAILMIKVTESVNALLDITVKLAKRKIAQIVALVMVYAKQQNVHVLKDTPAKTVANAAAQRMTWIKCAPAKVYAWTEHVLATTVSSVLIVDIENAHVTAADMEHVIPWLVNVTVKLANHVAKHGQAQLVTKELAQMTVTTMAYAMKQLANVVVNQDLLVKHVKLNYALTNVATMVCALTVCAYASTDGADWTVVLVWNQKLLLKQ